MIPSLVTRELRDAVVEYLSTTFSLTEDDTAVALKDFLESEAHGIFRGPYLRLRLPFVEADPSVPSPLHWDGSITPYAHQLAAWIRLVGRGRTPAPTLLTTGTGSGKTEGFLVPIVDHCVWARQQGQIGVKAIVLYPMNALVADQERRVAKFMADPVVAAAAVRAGVWIGGDASIATLSAMTKERLITDRDVMKADPPDILLTNYKMLDRLLTNAGNSKLWAANTPPASGASGWEQPLKYVVLDEFHSYDGAQGTDVAMLLRRLGDRLGIATPTNALTGVGPVGTSATLGSATTGTVKMVEFASRVFGVPFDLSAVIGEQRKTLDQVIPQKSLDFDLPFPSPAEVDAITVEPLDLDGLATAFTGAPFVDSVAVGEAIETHRLTRTLLGVTSGPPRDWAEVVAEVSDRSLWSEPFLKDPETVSRALAKFVALLSKCKRPSGAALFGIEMQLWVREVARLLRSVDATPGFKWADSPLDPDAGRVLPSVFCTVCGRSGWMGVGHKTRPGPLIESLGDEPASVYAASVGTKDQRSRTRTLIRANPTESGILWLSQESGQVHAKNDGGCIPILVGGMDGPDGSEKARDEVALRQECPSCGSRDAIRFLGSRVTTLASVSITQMFGSTHVTDDERRLLAFTDSVQDASHRASFFGGRTHRFNLRAVLSKQVQDAKGPLPLTDAADAVIADALTAVDPRMALFALTPPDIVKERLVVPCWESNPPPRSGVEAIRDRVRFDVAMEFGLRARLGRTIETTGTGVAAVHIDSTAWDEIVTEARSIFDAHRSTLPLQPVEIDHWVRGVIDRVRLRGGINHPWFKRYFDDGGRRWPLWGGRPSLMAAFPTGISAPAFPVSVAPNDRSEFDVITGRQSWYGNWAERILGITGAAADNCTRDLFELLAHHQVLAKQPGTKSASVAWALPPENVHIHDVDDGDDGETVPSELICDTCQTRHYVPAAHTDSWDGRLCLRYRCAGRYAVDTIPAANYYRRLYRKGTIRRVVANEHTGMLEDAERREVEDGFRGRPIPPGPKVTDPNVIVATPTLEMGIDIGDLSAVMLTSVPRNQASYVQRAGRAGRKTGNALITTFAEADPRSLYFLTDPTMMIAGDIEPPACYLDAPEILHRQYLAFLVDRAAAGVFDPGSKMPHWISGMVGPPGRGPGGWLTAVLAHGSDVTVVDRFISLFGSELSAQITAAMQDWVINGLASNVNMVLDRWAEETRDLRNRRKRLGERERELENNPHRTAEEDEDLGRIISEGKSLGRNLASRAQHDSLGALEALGLLPNYSLFDDAVTINANLWQLIEDPAGGKPTYKTDRWEKTRPATQAIREFAPGNHFYVNAHKITVDAVEIGPDSEPHHRLWRLCPDCGYGTDSPDVLTQCPRCGTNRIVEAARQLPLLPIRAVHSTDSEIKTRTTDDSDDRDQMTFEMVTTVDFDPTDIVASYKHDRVVFGVEAARNVTIRYLNLGRLGPTKTRIAGHENTVSLFKVCTRCGGVLGVRADRQKPDEKGHHQGFCKVRSGALVQDWASLALSHELRTEAVRFLLPVSTFEAVERIASFQAALLTGLADSYGGDPENLRIVTSTFPSEDGDTNHFLVLHDTVPGGTGYLHRLADPVRLREILTAARTIISTCPCQTKGLPGCHRCLYGHTHRSQLPLITRPTALSVLDELLSDWKLTRQDGTIAGTRLEEVRQSELERKFRLLLRAWAATTKDVTLADNPDPTQIGQVVFDLRFADGGPRWRIIEQKDVRVKHNTVPDFWATRADTGNTPPVAIFLDGWEHHGRDPHAVDGDATKRASLRAAGVSVWSLTWGDVDDAHAHFNDQTRPLGHKSPLNADQHRNGAGFLGHVPGAPAALDLHPFLMLAAYLRHPDADGWKLMAEATAIGASAQATAARTTTDSIHEVVVAVAAHRPVPASAGPHTVVRWRTDNDVRGVTVLSPANVVTAAVTYDTTTVRPEAADDLIPWKRGWADWMHLGNLVQHLGPNRVTVTTTELASSELSSGLASSATVVAPAPGAGPVDFSDCYDPATAVLVRAAVSAGHTHVVFGLEADDSDGTTIEAAWPDRKVGIIVDGNPIGASLMGAGWILKHAGDWTPETLSAALEGTL